MDIKRIPIIINNRNRLTMLKKLVDSIELNGSQDIFIIDNASTYAPLLEYYHATPHKVFRLNQNVGYLAFWELGIFEKFAKNHYVYTDPDVIPDEKCPSDYLNVFLEGLDRHKSFGKVGFSLRIDDLPSYYLQRADVIRHEAKFWERPLASVGKHKFYEAKIDTTFALYRPFSRGGFWLPALRTAPPYSARHLPWYVNSIAPEEEELFYQENANSDASWNEFYNRGSL